MSFVQFDMWFVHTCFLSFDNVFTIYLNLMACLNQLFKTNLFSFKTCCYYYASPVMWLGFACLSSCQQFKKGTEFYACHQLGS